MRNIRRYEHNGATSWVGCLKRAGKKYEEYFADGDDGREASLQRAKTWRNTMEKKLEPWNKLHRRSSVNTSGTIGVSVLDDLTRSGTLVRRWVANWPGPDGRKRKRSFSVPAYGEEGARKRAIVARQAGVAELFASRAIR